MPDAAPAPDAVAAPAVKPRRKKSLEGMYFQPKPDGTHHLISATTDQLAGADREYLSHSVAEAVDQCPAGHLAKNNMPRPVDPFAPNETGSGSHDVLEHVYLQPRGTRDDVSFDRHITDVTERVWSQKRLVELYPPGDDETRQLRSDWEKLVGDWAKRIRLMEDPDDIDVVGAEIDMAGTRTSNGVLSTGKIDRLQREKNGLLTIVDYKFGVWKGEPNPRFTDGYKDQQYRYFDLYWQMTGERPTGMQILYPRHPHRRIIDFKQADYESALTRFKDARDKLDEYVAAKSFPAKPGPLCAWCDIARACPVAQVKRVAEFDPRPGQPLSSMPEWKQQKRQKTIKANDNARTKPTSVSLGIRIVDADGTDRGIFDDSRFQQPEPSSYVPADHPDENPTVVPVTAPATGTRIGLSPASLPEEKTMTTPLPYPTAKWAAIALTRLADTATAHLNIRGQQLTPAAITALTRTLAAIVERTVRDTFGTFDWSHDAASRTAVTVEQSIKSRPAPFGQSAEAWQAWAGLIAALSQAKLRAGLGILLDDAPLTDSEWASLVTTTVEPVYTDAPASHA